MLTSDLRYEVSRTHYGTGARFPPTRCGELFAGAGSSRPPAACATWFNGDDRDRALGRDALWRADLRDRRAARRPRSRTPPIWWRRSRTAFIASHEELYTYASRGQEVVFVNARVAAVGKVAGGRRWRRGTAAAAASCAARQAAGLVRRLARGAGLCARTTSGPAHTLTGPAMIEAETTTVLVDTGDRVTRQSAGLDARHNIALRSSAPPSNISFFRRPGLRRDKVGSLGRSRWLQVPAFVAMLMQITTKPNVCDCLLSLPLLLAAAPLRAQQAPQACRQRNPHRQYHALHRAAGRVRHHRAGGGGLFRHGQRARRHQRPQGQVRSRVDDSSNPKTAMEQTRDLVEQERRAADVRLVRHAEQSGDADTISTRRGSRSCSSPPATRSGRIPNGFPGPWAGSRPSAPRDGSTPITSRPPIPSARSRCLWQNDQFGRDLFRDCRKGSATPPA